MTNYKVECIICLKNNVIKDINTIKITKIRRIVKANNIMELSQEMFKKTSKKEVEDKDNKIASRTVAEYLVYLFKNYAKDYSCTKTKIGKLLAITALFFGNKNKEIFCEVVRKYGTCGAVIEGLKSLQSDYAFGEKTVFFNYSDDEIVLNNIPWDLALNTDNKFNIPSEIKRVVLDIFIHFGAYSPAKLGEYLTDIITQKNITSCDGIVDVYKISELRCASNTTNPILKYIFKDD